MHCRFRTVVLLMFVTAPLRADVFLERQTVLEGLLTLGKMKMLSQVYIHGDLKREESVTTWSGLLGLTAAPQKDFILIDLSKGVQYRLDLDRKTYTVDSLQALGGVWTGHEEPPTGAPPDTGLASPFPDSSTVVLVRSNWTVQGPLERQTLHGFEATHYLIEWVSVWADTAKQETLQHTLTLDLWNTEDPTLQQALEEEADYQRRLLAKMGIEIPEGLGSLSGIESVVLMLQTQFPEGAQEDLEKQFKRVQGVPVRLTLTSKTTVLGETQEPVEEEEPEPEPSGSPFGGLFGKIQKKVQEQLQKPVEEELSKRAEEKLKGPVIQITSEILRAQVAPLEPSMFQIPEGFQEVSPSLQK